jgi:two-component system, NarL family, sensor histidine kinase UhpB
MTTHFRNESLWRDIGLVALITFIGGILAARFELSEAIFTVTRAWEHWQIDELPALLVVLCAGLAWFAGRRYREARAEIARRRAAEAQLEALLLENRRLAQRYVQVQEAERKFIARELHDELGQYLNAIKIDAVGLQQKAAQDAPVMHVASSIIQHADHVYGVVRDLIRRLRPIGLDELGLKAALEQYVSDWRSRLPGVQLAVSFAGNLDAVSEPLALTLYRLLQEGITNISRHAHARQVRIQVQRSTTSPRATDDEIVFTLTDDGRGTDLGTYRQGLGLIGMRERVEMLGGQLRVTTAPGAGFGILARIPAGGVA